MKKLAVTTSLVITLATLTLTAGPAAAKHHRTPMDRWNTRVHHQEARDQRWARDSDEKARAAEEKRASHQAKWEQQMDAIGRPNQQTMP